MVRRILFKGVAVLTAATVAIAALTGGQAWLETSETVSAQATSTITGTVYRDAGIDGVFASSDSGVEGVTVSAYNSSGAKVAETTTGADGTYTLTFTNLHLGTVRVEFETPQGLQPTIVSGGSLSSIQFVEPGSTGVDYGIFDPNEDCPLMLMSVCLNQGTTTFATGERVLSVASFSNPTVLKFGVPIAAGTHEDLITTLTTGDLVGATWGLAVQRNLGLFWNSAVIRRHAGLGPQGIGGIYVTDRSGTQVTSFDIAGSVTLSANNSAFSDANRDIRDSLDAVDGFPSRAFKFLSRDLPGFSGVGKAGIGDIEITDDGQYLWVTNLYERKVHRFPILGNGVPTLGAVESWSVDDAYSCVVGGVDTGPLRPWGLEVQDDGSIMVAAICANENSDALQKPLPGLGAILHLEPEPEAPASPWALMTTVDFSYTHSFDYCDKEPLTCKWKAWSDDWSKISSVGNFINNGNATSQYWYPQPMPIGLATLPDGSFVLGVSDRLSYMLGQGNYAPVSSSAQPAYVDGWVAGDTLLICKDGDGWTQEAGGKCGSSYESSRDNEFFYDSFGHPETTIGGMVFADGQIAVAAMDPADYYLGGVRWLSAQDGDQTNALNLTQKKINASDRGLGKSAGIGDLEVFCDQAPLQIGNYVWYDLNNNGIQDPDELPVVGVTVRLYNASTNASLALRSLIRGVSTTSHRPPLSLPMAEILRMSLVADWWPIPLTGS
jgi:hypothetical protein